MFDWLIYKNINLDFDVVSEDNQKRHVYLNYTVKRNWSWYKYREILPINIITVVRYYFYTNKSAYWHEGENRFRIIDDRKLNTLNKCVNFRIKEEIRHLKGIVLKNINITHII